MSYRDFILGLDLGQRRDPSALAVVERTLPPEARGRVVHGVRLLKRWPLGTSYVDIARDLAKLVAKAPLGGSLVAVDETGVGGAVIELIRAEKPNAVLKPILITAGHQAGYESGSWHVPKKALVSVVQALLQSRRLKVAPVPERELLVRELSNFRVKITAAANEQFESWRESDHDDLVLAVAMACWLGEREKMKAPGGPRLGCAGPQQYGCGVPMHGVW